MSPLRAPFTRVNDSGMNADRRTPSLPRCAAVRCYCDKERTAGNKRRQVAEPDTPISDQTDFGFAIASRIVPECGLVRAANQNHVDIFGLDELIDSAG